MSEATKVFFIVGESTITSPYKYKKFRLPKKVQVREKKTRSSTHSASRQFHTNRQGLEHQCGLGFSRKNTQPEMLPKRLNSCPLTFRKRYVCLINPVEHTLLQPSGLFENTGQFPSCRPPSSALLLDASQDVTELPADD